MGDVLMQNAGAAADNLDEGAQRVFYAKLANLEDEILAGTNPRIQLSETFLERLPMLSSSRVLPAPGNGAVTRSAEISHKSRPDDPRPTTKSLDAESVSLAVATNDACCSDPTVSTKTEQLRIAEIRLERQRIERGLKKGAENQQSRSQMQRVSAVEMFDGSQIRDIPHLLDEARSAVPHYSGVAQDTILRGSIGSSPFDDGYYSSKANSPWSPDTYPRDGFVPFVRADSDIVELESEPMDIEDQVFHENEEGDGEHDEMEAAERNSIQALRSNRSLSSGDAYSPEPYEPYEGRSIPADHGSNHGLDGFYVGHEESYSPPNALEFDNSTGLVDDVSLSQVLPRPYTSPDGYQHRLHEIPKYRDVLPPQNDRADRSESYSPPSPDFNAIAAGQDYQQNIMTWNHPHDNALYSWNNLDLPSSIQEQSNHQPSSLPHQPLRVEQGQNIAHRGIANGHGMPQATNNSRQIQPGQHQQLLNANGNNSKRKSKKSKRIKQSNQNTSLTEPDFYRSITRNKRAAMDEIIPAQHLPPLKRMAGDRPSSELYIKPEPLSPPGFGASETEVTEPRRRVVRYADGTVEIEPYQALSEVPKVRHALQSGSAPDDLVPIWRGSVHGGTTRSSRSLSHMGSQAENLASGSPRSSPLVHVRRRGGSDLRRVASMQYASRPQSPPRERYWQEGAEYPTVVRPAAARQGSYVVEPSGGISSQAAFGQSPVSRRPTEENFEAPDIYVRQAYQPPRQKIIIDEDGNEYIAVLRNQTSRPSDAILPALNYSGVGSTQEKPITYNAPFVGSRSVYDRARSSRPAPRVIELSDDEDYQLMPPPRIPPDSRLKQADYGGEPSTKRVEDYQPQNAVRAISLQPAFRTTHTPISLYGEAGRLEIDSQPRFETAASEARLAPARGWDAQTSGLRPSRERASSAMPHSSGHPNQHEIGAYDPTRIRYRRF